MEPCIDTHCHIFDPTRFPYAADTAYRPQGQEAGSADTLVHTMDAHGIHHALAVGPNSGYGTDNRCLLDAYGPERCLWATDWPFLRAPERIDLGPLQRLAQVLMPDEAVRRQVMWRNAQRLLGWPASA